MPSFARNINETVTVESFLTASGNLGFGVSNYLLIGAEDAFGMSSHQSNYNQEAFGQLQNYPHGTFRFSPAGDDLVVNANIFDPAGQSVDASANTFDPLGDSADASWGLNVSRALSETMSFVDMLDYNGSFIRTLTENINFINRVGASKGVFFRDDLSSLVTSNSEVRLLSTIRDMGEVAVSQRPAAGPFKVLRYVPGTTPGVPNSVDLGSIPSTVASQGFILDDSPHGVLLRGSWEVKLVVFDSQASGQIKLHVSLFSVKATTSSVVQALKIGITQVTPAFTPSNTPTQYTLNWNETEAGEVFVADDEFLYVEVFVEEVVHPGIASLTRLRLNDFADTFYSQMRFPGVTDEPTYSLAPSAETVVLADTLNRIVGLNRPLTETLFLTGTVARSAGLVRNIIEVMTITDAQVRGIKNNIVEFVTIVESLDRLLVLNRPLTENVTVTANLSFHVSTTNNLIENMPITATVSGFIVRPPRRPLTDGLNKRPVDPYKAVRKRNI